jgi:hypothetical protein
VAVRRAGVRFRHGLARLSSYSFLTLAISPSGPMARSGPRAACTNPLLITHHGNVRNVSTAAYAPRAKQKHACRAPNIVIISSMTAATPTPLTSLGNFSNGTSWPMPRRESSWATNNAELMNARTVVTPHTMTPNTFRRMRLRRWRHQHSPSHRISSNVSRANSSCKTRRTSKRSRHLFFCQFLDREDAASGNRHDPARLRVVGVIEIADALTDDLDVVIVLQEPSDRRALNRPRPRQRRQVLPGRQRLTRAPLLPQEPSSSTSNP